MSLARVVRVVAIGAVLGGLALLSGAVGATPKLAPLAISRTLRTAGDPGAIAIDITRSRAYVTDSRENTLYVFDLASAQPVAFIPDRATIDHESLEHEYGHISQAKEYGLTYLPRYVLGASTVPGNWLALFVTGHPVSFHDAHPMERDAEYRADHPDPWGSGYRRR